MNYSRAVSEKLFELQKLDKEIILKLIEKHEMRIYVNDLLTKIQESDRKEVALEFIKEGEGHDVANKLGELPELDRKEVALKLIEFDKSCDIANNLDKLPESDRKEIALKLIEASEGYNIANNLDKLPESDRKEIALKLIEASEGYNIANNLDKLPESDRKEVALKLIEMEFAGPMLYNLDKLPESDRKEIALKLIEVGKYYEVVKHLKQFSELDMNIAIMLIDLDEAGEVAANLEIFKISDYNEIALRMIEKNEQGESMIYHRDKFRELDYKKIAISMIERGEISRNILAEHFDELPEMDQGILIKFIETIKEDEHSTISELITNSHKIKEVNCKRIFQKLDEKGFGSYIINMKQLEELDEETAFRLIEMGKGIAMATILSKFQGLDHKKVALKLIETRQGEAVGEYLNNFQGLNHKEIALKLFETGQGEVVARNISNFHGLDKEIALRLIEADLNWAIARNRDKFQGLDGEIALRLIKAGWDWETVTSLDIFQRSDNLYNQARVLFLDFILQIEKDLPSLNEQIRKTPKLLLQILASQNNYDEIKDGLTQNPFLIDALETNPHYGIKMLLKFPEFDKTAQKNIQILYKNKAEIFKDNPNIDPDSYEFRVLMQEKLLDYKNNRNIISQIFKGPVQENQDLEKGTKDLAWLNHDEVIDFALGEEDVAFSERVHIPMKRIEEILNKYQSIVSGVLAEYQKELKSFSIPNPARIEIEQYIAGMEEQLEDAKNGNDEKRAKGLEKGLEANRAKLEKLKPINLWSKINTDIHRLELMARGVADSNQLCAKDEENIQHFIETKDRKALIEMKIKFDKDKRLFREKFMDVENVVDSFGDNLRNLISEPLGNERTESLLQEISSEMSEDFMHYNSDKETLRSIFEDKKDKNPLDGTDMSISIASRNPDSDLYLGNYCPCCICIESEYHGEESPIADYVTDLGMQNVVVYNDRKKIPVVACWCFIGEDKEGKRALVIDNIEANTEYSSNYPEQISRIIRGYIEDYAKACGLDRIVQGPDNNDLEVFELGKIERKLGGIYNRIDGYYLEAETDDDQEDDFNDDEN
jgi:hypothetical protein